MNRNLHELITWLPSRLRTDLNGSWRSIIDVYDVGLSGPFGGEDDDTTTAADSPVGGFPRDRGRTSPGRRAEYDFDTSPPMDVPGDWNTQYERYHFYEGSMWYRRRFEVGDGLAGTRTFLYVAAANHAATVFLNGRRIADHEGGFGPFCVEITEPLRDDAPNTLVIRVNNRRRRSGVPTTRTDWFNYGGLTRDVCLIHVPRTFIRDAVVQLDPADVSIITAEVSLDGPERDQTVEIMVDGALVGELQTTDGVGHGRFRRPDSIALWTPETPELADVVVRARTDEVGDRIGFRTVETDGSTILLNGSPVFLAGVSLHDEALGEPAQRIRTEADARAVLSVAKDLGCNFVRLAHYQHNEHTVRACDELGLIAWCELPVYWAITWEDDDTLTNARDQLRELVVRDRNRAAVVLWSVANETPPGDARTAFLRRLVDDTRELDGTRLVTAALFARPESGDFRAAFAGDDDSDWIIDDPLGAHLDVLGVNQYHGWYYGSYAAMAAMRWSTPYDKPLIVSEFGAGARHGLRGADDESWTEDMQAAVYRHQFAMLGRIPFLAGTSPWILKDFRAPFRLLPGVQDGFNRKGLVDPAGNRKVAFDIVAEWNRSRTT